MDVFKEIEKLNGGKMSFGTERTRAILDGLSCPDKDLKIIHIAGTNGKGSTAEYLTRILVRAKKKVGTFTSPQIFSPADMFSVDAKPADGRLLKECLKKTLSLAAGATPFEVYTAGALYYFKRSGCEYAVLECGLGGTYDATNAVCGKVLAVICSIGLEHTAYLGDSIASICSHKAGIIKNCPAVVNPLQPEEALDYFSSLGAKIAGGPLVNLGFDGVQKFSYCGEEYSSQMFGYAQMCNAATAIEVARLLKIPQNCIRNGISDAKLDGRLQIIRARGNTYVLDGSHNPQSFLPLKELLLTLKGDKSLIFGCLSDKDIEGDLRVLDGLFARAAAVQPPSPRAMGQEEIFCALKRHFPDVKKTTLIGALEEFCGTVVVCGSFTLLKEATEWIEKE